MVRTSPGKTRHALIFEHVHSAIMAGRYKIGQRIPSETQLSRRFGTTRVTVDRALRGDCLEIAMVIEPGDAAEFGIKVRGSPGGEEQTPIVCTPAAHTLKTELAGCGSAP